MLYYNNIAPPCTLLFIFHAGYILLLQTGIPHMFLFITFYVDYALIFTQLILHLWADQKAADASIKHELYQHEMAADEQDKVDLAAELKIVNISEETASIY